MNDGAHGAPYDCLIILGKGAKRTQHFVVFDVPKNLCVLCVFAVKKKG
jgi:hypothetical protein